MAEQAQLIVAARDNLPMITRQLPPGFRERPTLTEAGFRRTKPIGSGTISVCSCHHGAICSARGCPSPRNPGDVMSWSMNCPKNVVPAGLAGLTVDYNISGNTVAQKRASRPGKPGSRNSTGELRPRCQKCVPKQAGVGSHRRETAPAPHPRPSRANPACLIPPPGAL